MLYFLLKPSRALKITLSHSKLAAAAKGFFAKKLWLLPLKRRKWLFNDQLSTELRTASFRKGQTTRWNGEHTRNVAALSHLSSSRQAAVGLSKVLKVCLSWLLCWPRFPPRSSTKGLGPELSCFLEKEHSKSVAVYHPHIFVSFEPSGKALRPCLFGWKAMVVPIYATSDLPTAKEREKGRWWKRSSGKWSGHLSRESFE